MLELSRIWAFSCFLLISRGVSSYVEALSGTADLPAAHFEPQVAMYCGEKGQSYHSQYMTESGHWVTDLNNKATCLKDKLEILEYCKKVYPKRDITNIVESSHFQKISNWCKVGHKKCKGTHYEWVKPYRCLDIVITLFFLLVRKTIRHTKLKFCLEHVYQLHFFSTKAHADVFCGGHGDCPNEAHYPIILEPELLAVTKPTTALEGEKLAGTTGSVLALCYNAVPYVFQCEQHLCAKLSESD
ncbi:amyloid-beta precursor protein [Anabrus simplex]|uniref:amyloid-beta precursor protein n=1 Tax=Anabrus simplex TaxID=316456 RepID=UPI0035A2A0A9